MDFSTFISQSPSFPLLFFISFLAATVLPLGSEWLLVLMLTQGFSLEQTVITAATGNYLGGCTTFFMGIWGADFLVEKVLRIDEKQLKKANNFYQRYGCWSLLLTWLPIIGDPLCLIAGILKTGFIRFSVLVFVGKFMRYATLAFLVQQGLAYTGG